MSETQMENLRRICLICGCHTSQIINVFEPRNGPNIVELIRAKFKFQPVNDDKYLCYSCNNWLINWHSLKNLNKDTVEDQPDKSRPQFNESMPETDQSSRLQYTNRSQRPRQPDDESHHLPNTNSRRNGFYFPKRPALKSCRIENIGAKLRNCTTCGRSIRKRPCQSKTFQKSIRSTVRCRRCSKLHKRSSTLFHRTEGSTRHSRRDFSSSNARRGPLRNLVNSNRYHLPALDRKLVARLQRLGTTLVWETTDQVVNSESWTASRPTTSIVKDDTRNRVNKQNEVLIDFNRVLSEVLPLRYGISQPEFVDIDGERSEADHGKEVESAIERNEDNLLDIVYCKLPGGVTVSLVEESHSRVD